MAKDMVQVRKPRTNRFAEEPNVRVGRSQMDLSHMLKVGFDASYLYPILVDEVLPGDTVTCSLNGFVRITHPLEAPILDNIELDTFFFFVPNRLIWDNWKYFQGEHDAAGAQDTDYTIPILSGATGITHNAGLFNGYALGAYLGLPAGLEPDNTDVNQLPFRAYKLIYNEWFRDQNLIDEATLATDDGPQNISGYILYKSAKKHDYFTSALPYLQKGDAENLWEGTTFDVETLAVQGNEITIESGSGQRDLDSSGANVIVDTTNTGSAMYIDTSAVNISINDLRESVAIQRLLEKDARGGTRYVEIIKSHFGVTSPDFRLQRPEYLGGGKAFINVNPVAQTDTSVGDLGAYGTGVINGHGWAKSFVEHGYIIGMVRARGDVTYFQGLPRMYSRSTRYDFYMPALAMLGEQSILNKELFVKNDGSTTDDLTFGYTERWNEYRFKPSRIVGNLNPDSSSALSHWHLAEDHSDTPDLNQTFIEDATPMDRVTTTDTGNQFLADIWFNYRWARPIPVHSIPSLVGMRF